jgi:hypothetical protein
MRPPLLPIATQEQSQPCFSGIFRTRPRVRLATARRPERSEPALKPGDLPAATDGMLVFRPVSRRFLILLVLLSLVTGACRSPEPVAKKTAQRATPSPSPSPSPSPEPILCPLTGAEAPPGIDVNRPALAIKIDNHVAARPQAGLEFADVVYEELVEGGITRFLGVFQCQDAPKLGPTRSARMVDPDLLVMYSPVLFAYSGANDTVLAKVRSTAGVIDLPHGANGSAYYRQPGRPAPHNLFTSTDRIRSLPKAQGVPGAPKTGYIFDPSLTSGAAPSPSASPAATGASPSPSASPSAPGASPSPSASVGVPPAAGSVGSSVSFSYSSSGNGVSFTYDPAGRRYLRSAAGQPHKAESGQQLGAANVLVLKVKVSQGLLLGSGGHSPAIAVTGEGEATVLRAGVAIQGKWTRAGLSDQITLVDSAGQPIKLVPGNIWINLLPSERPVTVQ